MRRVASMGMPAGRGAAEAKKKPPRETFRASVKCSVLSAATPSARKRRGGRRLRRDNCRRSATFILCPLRDEGTGADSCEFGAGDFQRSRASRAVKYQTWSGQEVPVPARSACNLKSSARAQAQSACHNASLTAATNVLQEGALSVKNRQAFPSPK